MSQHDSPWFHVVQVDYILLTARYWKDFSNLDVDVLAPHGTRLESSLPLSFVEGQVIDRYTSRSPSLPDSNLRVAAALPLAIDAVVFRFVGGGSEDAGRSKVLALPMVIIPIVIWAATARYGSRGVGRKDK